MFVFFYERSHESLLDNKGIISIQDKGDSGMTTCG